MTEGRSAGAALLAGLGRSARLRCPRCGARGIVDGWFRLAGRCSGCGLVPDRGEHDHFLGAMLLNLVVAELVAVGGIVVLLVLVWPDPPWGAVTAAGVVLAAGLPVAFYPFSRLLWLSLDLVFRPPEEDAASSS